MLPALHSAFVEQFTARRDALALDIAALERELVTLIHEHATCEAVLRALAAEETPVVAPVEQKPVGPITVKHITDVLRSCGPLTKDQIARKLDISDQRKMRAIHDAVDRNLIVFDSETKIYSLATEG